MSQLLLRMGQASSPLTLGPTPLPLVLVSVSVSLSLPSWASVHFSSSVPDSRQRRALLQRRIIPLHPQLKRPSSPPGRSINMTPTSDPPRWLHPTTQAHTLLGLGMAARWQGSLSLAISRPCFRKEYTSDFSASFGYYLSGCAFIPLPGPDICSFLSISTQFWRSIFCLVLLYIVSYRSLVTVQHLSFSFCASCLVRGRPSGTVRAATNPI